MIEELASAVVRQGPLRVDEVGFADPTVTLAGEEWSLAITCPWRLVRESALVVTWDDPAAADHIWDLVGNSVVAVSSRSAEHPNDPVVVLTDGYRLEIEADTDLDPWVFRLPDHTFVGSGP